MRIANYTQSFNISEMAKELGLSDGQKIDIRVNVDGECYWVCKNAYLKCRVSRVRITEAKNGHTTLKVWAFQDELDDWYKEHETSESWWMYAPETLESVKEAIKAILYENSNL